MERERIEHHVLQNRGLYTPAPAFRPTFLDRPTLLVTYWCFGLCVFIIIARLFWRFVRINKVFRDDWWMLSSIIPLGIRIGLIHIVLTWGTNNMSFDGFEQYRDPRSGKEYVKWDLEEEVRRREVGSKLVLISRIAYAAFIWSQKLCITEFHRKLNLSFWNTSYKGVLGGIRWLLVVTFVGVVVSILAECSPFVKYWQVLPDPGPRCRQGIAPLIVMAVCNAVTDLAIVIFPLPPILIASMPFKRRFWLIVSLSLSLFTCALAIYKVPFVLQYHASQPHRTLYSSLETLASCAIANAIVLNAFARDKGPKRNRYRGPGGPDTVYSPETIAKRGRTGDQERLYALDVQSTRMGMRVWGSDEDLVKDTGVGMNGDLRKMSDAAQRHSTHSAHSSTCALGCTDLEHAHMANHSEASQGCPPWATTWEDPLELQWRESSENGSGRGLVLPPPPPVAHTSSDNRKTAWDPRLSGSSFPNMPPQDQKLGESGTGAVSADHWERSPSQGVSFLDVGGLLNQSSSGDKNST